MMKLFRLAVSSSSENLNTQKKQVKRNCDFDYPREQKISRLNASDRQRYPSPVQADSPNEEFSSDEEDEVILKCIPLVPKRKLSFSSLADDEWDSSSSSDPEENNNNTSSFYSLKIKSSTRKSKSYSEDESEEKQRIRIRNVFRKRPAYKSDGEFSPSSCDEDLSSIFKARCSCGRSNIEPDEEKNVMDILCKLCSQVSLMDI